MIHDYGFLSVFWLMNVTSNHFKAYQNVCSTHTLSRMPFVSTTLIAAVVLLSVTCVSVSAFASSSSSTRPGTKDKRTSITTFKFPKKTHQKQQAQPGNAAAAAATITESPTDPPQPDQPSEFLVSLSDFCTGQLVLSPQDYNLFSGTYTVPPPPTVPMVDSGLFNYGFAVQGDSVTHDVNGTLMYTCPNCTVWPTDIPLSIGFASVQGEWMFELSYWTPLLPLIMSSDIGPRAVYNLLIGHRFDLVRC